MKALENGILFEQSPMLYALAKSLSRSIDATDDEKKLLFYSINLLGLSLSQGHVALRLETYQRQPAPSEWQVDWLFPDVDQWAATLLSLFSQLSSPSVILRDNHLLLSRYDALENFIVSDLLARAQHVDPIDWLDFSYTDKDQAFDWQKMAVANSLSERLSFIVGGPGTGKTTTVSQLLTTLLEKEGHDKYIIKLAAPTGKAATRMASSLQEKMQQTDLAKSLKDRLPNTANTLHRLLGWSEHKRAFTYNASNPLFVDCLVVDEASMIDISLFAALLAAVPHSARLIFLGDPYQLPSVQAGSVLSDICGEKAINLFREEKAKAIPTLQTGFAPLADNIVQLKKSHRFSDDKGIGALAKACLDHDVARLSKALATDDIVCMPKTQKGLSAIQDQLTSHWQTIKGAASLEQGFSIMATFQLLCGNKNGALSTGFFNQFMQRFAAQSSQELFPMKGDLKLYHGMPIMLESNRYDLGLYNGDIGVVWVEEGVCWLCFMDQNLEIQRFLPQQVQGFSPAHAITVHKSQGSEYTSVAFVSPKVESPLLSNQLLYTAVTRAKSKVFLLANDDEMKAALRHSSNRNTLLHIKLERAFDCMV